MRKTYLFILFVIIFRNLLFSQQEKQLSPSEVKQMTVVEEPITLNKGFFRFGLSTSYISFEKSFDNNGKKYNNYFNSTAKSWEYKLIASYGVSDRLQMNIEIPFINGKTFISSKNIIPIIDSVYTDTYLQREIGFEDIRLSFYYQILTETYKRPSVTFDGYVSIPTGSKEYSNVKNEFQYDYPTSNGSYILSSSIVVRKIFYPYSALFYATFDYPLKGRKKMDPFSNREREFQGYKMIYLKTSFLMMLNEWITVGNEPSYLYLWGKWVEGVSQPFVDASLLNEQVSLYFQIKRIRFSQYIVFALMGKNSSADPIYYIRLQYTL